MSAADLSYGKTNPYTVSMPKRIKTQKFYESPQPNAKPLLLMCGLWGSVWQMRRLIRTLNNAGYDVTALAFTNKIITSGDPQLMIDLVDQVVDFADKLARENTQPVELVGVSFGALLALNIVRRLPAYKRGVLITGGDIAKIVHWFVPWKWRMPYSELANVWQELNMYSEPSELRGKHLLFVLHSKGRMIDPSDAIREIAKHRQAGNQVIVVERHRFGHIGTIVEETILRPARVLEHLGSVKQSK